MKCPFCNADNSKVIDSRVSTQGNEIKRRRECIECKKRFTTYERIEETPIIVIKKDGSRQEFSRQKILMGLFRATEKRKISRERLENIVSDIEKDIQNNLKGEVNTIKIGELVMEKLKLIDHVAYVRFASVYKEFKDLEGFMNEIEKIKNK